MTKEFVPRCDKMVPACVCTPETIEEIGKLNKCIFDACDAREAAITFTRMTEDCGAVSSSIDSQGQSFDRRPTLTLSLLADEEHAYQRKAFPIQHLWNGEHDD
jgi:peroxiredoxin